MKIGGAHHPPRGYLIVRTALSYNNLDRAERTGTHPSKAVPNHPILERDRSMLGAGSGPMIPNTCQRTTVTVAARTIRVTLAAIHRSPHKAKLRLDAMIAASRRRHSVSMGTRTRRSLGRVAPGRRPLQRKLRSGRTRSGPPA